MVLVGSCAERFGFECKASCLERGTAECQRDARRLIAISERLSGEDNRIPFRTIAGLLQIPTRNLVQRLRRSSVGWSSGSAVDDFRSGWRRPHIDHDNLPSRARLT